MGPIKKIVNNEKLFLRNIIFQLLYEFVCDISNCAANENPYYKTLLRFISFSH